MSGYRYTFASAIPFEEIEASVLLALLGTEALHGETQTRLDACHEFAPLSRTCVIETDTQVGQTLNRLFATFLRREFGDDQFRVERLTAESAVAA